ncbi:MAG: cytidylate kinase-like family protein [Candidatus Schekmanbacteria bacterium]|nr:MAG: cytidylate kinase-like family protein [Candidatus Schekmanbacteria bacterium]
MSIITISKEFASGGRKIAELVAEKLSFSYFDREIVKEVALKSKVPEIAVEEYDQDHYNAMRVFFSRVIDPVLSSARYKNLTIATGGDGDKERRRRKRFKPYECEVYGWLDSDIFREMIESFLCELVEKSNAVVVGRGAQCILKDYTNVLHVRIVAPLDYRIKRAIEEKKISEKEAKNTILEIDKRRQTYIRHSYGVDWNDPTLYHLVINTGRIDIESAADLIVATYKEFFKI